MDNRGNFYNLPYTTEQILEGFEPERECQNLGLLLDKYAPTSVFEKAGKAPWLLDILKPENSNTTQNNHIDNMFAENTYNRWRAMMGALGAETFDLTLDWRMIVGLGGGTVLETDITLHHLYGIPIIPGSALKGLTRAYVSEEYKEFYIRGDQPGEKLRSSKSTEEDHPEIKRIFGKQEEAGTICFFDAIPLHGHVQYVLDIMNPHYPNYYNSLHSNKVIAPSNDQQPNPVVFLTVTDTSFTFALAPRNHRYKDDVVLVKKWLREALQKYGVGGKTSAGYGYFKAEQQHTRPNGLQQFNKGDSIRGIVIDEKTDSVAARYIASGQASKCLQLLPFSTDQVLILVDPIHKDAKQWKVRNVSICQFIEERVEDNRILLICEPKKKN